MYLLRRRLEDEPRRDDINGALLARLANDGAHTDAIGGKGDGTYRYVLSEVGGPGISDEVTVRF